MWSGYTEPMEESRKLGVAVILLLLGLGTMVMGGFWFGLLLVSCGIIGLLAYWRGSF